MRPYLEETHHKKKKKIRLMEWFKVKALSSSPSTIKKKKKRMDTIIVPTHRTIMKQDFYPGLTTVGPMSVCAK
jgi:hypothetical protein